jgi:hypothetical protein
MDMTELLRQLGGVQSVARDLGIDETQATAGLEALLPAVLGGFKKQARAQPTGLDGLAGMLGGLLGGGGQQRGAPNLGSLLDLNRDGNPLDDILGMAGKLLR